MPYTLWSRGRLIGQSELAYARSLPGLRAGDFEPSPLAETLMPIIIGVGPALKALHQAADVVWEARERSGRRRRRRGWPDEVRQSTEYADAMSISDELRSLALELHDPTDMVIATEDIWLQDTHRLLALAREEMAEQGLDEDFDDKWEPWLPEPARYQIYVQLTGHDQAMRQFHRGKRSR